MSREQLRWGVLSLSLCGMLAAGCHTMHFQVVDKPAAEVVSERKSFFLWGLTPTKVVDVETKCPNGVVAIMEETTFVDGLAELFTLGIWGLRSSTYYCAAAPTTQAQR